MSFMLCNKCWRSMAIKGEMEVLLVQEQRTYDIKKD